MHRLALALACVTATAVAARDVNQNQPRRPHIVFVLADDYGFADVSYHARKYPNASNCSATPKNVIETPNLDRLAASGVKLESYYVQPVCSPTRAAILTGRYATHTGIHVPLVDSAPGVLPNEEVLLPALLKNAGYKTAMVGKWVSVDDHTCLLLARDQVNHHLTPPLSSHSLSAAFPPHA